MTLDTAIHILTEMHTNDDVRVGYVAHSAVSYHHRRYSESDVIEAWAVLRAHDHRPTQPEHYP